MRWCVPLALLWIVYSTGCSFSPSHDYDVVASWLLNGAPPDASRCRELGIDRMRLEMKGVGRPTVVEAPCDQLFRLSDDLVYGGLQSDLSFDYGVPYDYTLLALAKNGEPIFGYDATVAAYYGDVTPVELDTVDVFEPRGQTASLSAVWRFSTGDLASDCTANEVEEVAIVLASEVDPSFTAPFELFRVPCAKGSYDSGKKKILAQGNYLAKYVAFDTRGGVAEQSAPYPLVIEKSTTAYALDRHKFEGL